MIEDGEIITLKGIWDELFAKHTEFLVHKKTTHFGELQEILDKIPRLQFKPLNHLLKKFKNQTKIIKGDIRVNGQSLAMIKSLFLNGRGHNLIHIIDDDFFLHFNNPYEFLAFGHFIDESSIKLLVLLKEFILGFHKRAHIQLQMGLLSLSGGTIEILEEMILQKKFLLYFNVLKEHLNFDTNEKLFQYLLEYGKKISGPVKATLKDKNIELTTELTEKEREIINPNQIEINDDGAMPDYMKQIDSVTVLLWRPHNFFLEAFFHIMFKLNLIEENETNNLKILQSSKQPTAVNSSNKKRNIIILCISILAIFLFITYLFLK